MAIFTSYVNLPEGICSLFILSILCSSMGHGSLALAAIQVVTAVAASTLVIFLGAGPAAGNDQNGETMDKNFRSFFKRGEMIYMENSNTPK